METVKKNDAVGLIEANDVDPYSHKKTRAKFVDLAEANGEQVWSFLT